MARKDESNLCLAIQKVYFDKIASGKKKTEYRECKEYYDARFFKMADCAIACDSVGDNLKPIPKDIKTLTLIVGYNKGAPRMTLEVERISVVWAFKEETQPDGSVLLAIASETDLKDLNDVNEIENGVMYAIHLGRRIA